MRINESLSILVAYLVLLLSVFDSHITKLLGINSFIGLELLLILLLFASSIIICIKQRLSKLEIYSIILIGGAFFTSLILNKQIIVSFLGVLFLFKIFLFFIVGNHLVIRNKIRKIIIFQMVLLAVVSAIITFIQLFYSFNPFGFLEYNEKAMGILDNPNKNAIFLLVALILSNFYLITHKWLSILSFLFFISAIIATGSRQAMLVIVLVYLVYYVVIQKRFFIAFLILFCSSLFFLVFQNSLFNRFSEYDRISATGDYFRLKAILISVEAISDYPFFGTGTGFWGGKVADVYQSKYHKEYKLFAHWEKHRQKPATIDMYWPHAIVELGVIWFALYGFILIKMLNYFRKKYGSMNTANFLLLTIIFFTSWLSMSMAAPSISAFVFLLAGLSYNNKIKIV